jgi:nitroreductase
MSFMLIRVIARRDLMSQHPKHASPDHDIHDLIRQRWSPRAFDPARLVPRDELMKLFEAARWAPSSFNAQPWRFVVLERETHGDVWKRVLNTLSARNQSWAVAAPVLVVIVVQTTFEQTAGPNMIAWYDVGQAVATMALQATAQGLGLRQMEGFDRARARTELVIPPGYELPAIIAIGYVGDPDALPHEPHREAERQPRRRKKVEEFVSFGQL